MKVFEIASSDNQKLKLIRSLAQSNKQISGSDGADLILLEGHKIIREALNNGVKLHDVVLSQTWYDDQFSNSDLVTKLDAVAIVKDSIFKGLYTTDTSCGIVASATPKCYDVGTILSSGKPVLIADNIQDPGNVGTIIRTAYAFEAGGLILSKGSVHCHNPKVIRSSMGAIFSLPIVHSVELADLLSQIKRAGFQIVVLEGKAEQTMWEFEPANNLIAYILGNEGHGISPEVFKLADNIISIPINPSCESLNVAVAAGIILVHEKLKQAIKTSNYPRNN